MVKGNAQRRIELADRRKAESAEEKERRALGPGFATPTEARARLLSDARGAGEAALVAWVAFDGPPLCEDFFRTGACPLRRCRHVHGETLAALAGVPAVPGAPPPPPPSRLTAPARDRRSDGGRSLSALRARSASPARGRVRGARGGGESGGEDVGEDGVDAHAPLPPQRTELPALRAMPLREADPGGGFAYDRTVRTAVRAPWKLFFIALGDRLVFDSANPPVFAAYCDGAKATAMASTAATVAEAAAATIEAAPPTGGAAGLSAGVAPSAAAERAPPAATSRVRFAEDANKSRNE